MSVTKTMLIAILAASLSAHSAFAKNNGGSNHSSSSSGNKFSSFKLNTQTTSSSNSFKNIKVTASKTLNPITTSNPTTNGGSGGTTTKKPIGPGQVTGINTIKPVQGGGTTIVTDPGPNKGGKGGKNDCKKWDHCFPWYFGCYPSYNCYSYDYCCPTYSYCTPSYCLPSYGCSYESSLAVVPVAPSVGAARMKVALGSVLMLNGQAFGDKAGGARLRISGMALPIQVVEWTPSTVKVQLPPVELTSNTLADIEVVRPDGSLATKASVELTPAAEQLALGK